MVSIYELRLRYLLHRDSELNDRRLSGILPFDSGRSAIYFLLDYLKSEKGVARVYVNAYTTEVVHETIRSLNLALEPIDVDPLTFYPRTNETESLQGSVFMQTSLFGFHSVDRGAFERVKKAGGFFVEDCCNSFGSSFRGQDAGRVGDAAVFSFRVGKALSTGGGGLRVNNPDLSEDLEGRFRDVKPFSWIEKKQRLLRTCLDYLAFEPWILKYFSRPLRGLQKRVPLLEQIVKGGVVDTISKIDSKGIRRMSASELDFARGRLQHFEDEKLKKKEVSDILRTELAGYPLHIYANDEESYDGWNYLFFPVLLRQGNAVEFVAHLRRSGFDATRFHYEVPLRSFPGITEEEYPGTFTLVKRLVCVPNTSRMAGKEAKLIEAIDRYFGRRAG